MRKTSDIFSSPPPEECARGKQASRHSLAGFDLQVLVAPPGTIANRHLYVVRTPVRDELRRYLQNHGVQTLVHYPVSDPRQPALLQFVLEGQDFPVADQAVSEIVSLPLYPEMHPAELDYTIASLHSFYGR
jgi:dTDP-4-amino-4,6-dideoxygalactose transaminase